MTVFLMVLTLILRRLFNQLACMKKKFLWHFGNMINVGEFFVFTLVVLGEWKKLGMKKRKTIPRI